MKYILDEWVLKHSTTFICLIVQSSGVVSEWEIFRFDWRWCMGSGWHPSNSQTSQPLQSYQPHTHTGDTRLLRNWGFSSLKPGQLFNRSRHSWRSDAYSLGQHHAWAEQRKLLATMGYGHVIMYNFSGPYLNPGPLSSLQTVDQTCKQCLTMFGIESTYNTTSCLHLKLK